MTQLVKVNLIDFSSLRSGTGEPENLMRKLKLKFTKYDKLKAIVLQSLKWADTQALRAIFKFHSESTEDSELINYLKQFLVKPLIDDTNFMHCCEGLESLAHELMEMGYGEQSKWAYLKGESFEQVQKELLNNPKLKSDRNYILNKIVKHPIVLRLADESLRNDRTIVMEAVKRNGKSLEYASTELKNDREIVLAAVKNSGTSLQYANMNFRKDREIVLEAIATSDFALKIADSCLIKDREFTLEAVKRNGFCFNRVDPSFKEDTEICLESIRKNERCARLLDHSRLTDQLFIRECVKINSKVLQFSPLRDDMNFVRELFKDNMVKLSHFDKSIPIDSIKTLLSHTPYHDIGVHYQYNEEIIDFALEADLFSPQSSTVIQNNRKRMLKLLMKDLDIHGYLRYSSKEMLSILKFHFEKLYQTQ